MNLTYSEQATESGQEADSLVIFLHGYGSSGANLMDLANEFSSSLPNSHFISPNAPHPLEGFLGEGYQWFSLLNREPHIINPQIKTANDILDEFITLKLKEFSLTRKQLILIGFSQGSMMAMYNALRNKEETRAVVAYSGRLILPSVLGEEIGSKPQICLIHGTADEVVPFENMQHAERILTELKVPHEAHAIPDLEHSIDLEGLDIGKRFLEDINGRV